MGSGSLLALWTFSFLLGIFYSYAYLNDSVFAGQYWSYASIALALCFGWLLASMAPTFSPRTDMQRLVAILLGVNILANLYIRVDPGYIALAWLPLMLMPWFRPRLAIFLFSAFWVLLCVYLIVQTPGYLDLDGQAGGDMLAMVYAGSEAFLHGQNPHGQYYDEVAIYPFMYLPAMWLPYVPFVSMEWDLRILNLGVMFVIAAAATFATLRRADGLAAAPLLVMSSPLVSLLLINGQVWSYWLLCWAFALAAANRSVVLGACLLGLMLAARQWAVFFLLGFPFYVLKAYGWRTAAKAAAVVVAVFLVVTLPFVVWDPYFFNAIYLDPIREVHHNFRSQLAMTTVLGYFDLLEWKGVGLAATIVLGAVWVALSRSDSEAAWRAGLLFVAAVAFNTKVHPYYYTAGLLVAATALPWYVKDRRDSILDKGPEALTESRGVASAGEKVLRRRLQQDAWQRS